MDLYSRLRAVSDTRLTVKRVTIGTFTVMVETHRSTGLSSCFKDPPGSMAGGIPQAGRLTEETTGALMDMAENGGLLHRSLAMAALNASLPTPGDALHVLNGQDFLSSKTGKGHLVIVGHFPFVNALEKRVGKLSVIQEPPHLGERGVARARTLFPEADVVVITSSAFINGTMDALLAAASGAYVVLLGATTPMHPIMFEHGVDALCGARPVDAERLHQGIIQGASFRHLDGFDRVTWFRNPSGQKL